MTFLPIAVRELRVAARKPGTFWLRNAAALTGLVVGGGGMLLASLSGGGTWGAGPTLFSGLTWLAFLCAISAGWFFTSDCVSEERREGTLGLLFLTDLRGYDVVAGKLLSSSLRCFYALLAILPIVGLTLMLGGVTGTQFFHTCLALANGLFCSLAAGLFISSISRDSQRAMSGTFGLLVLMNAGGPLLDSLLSTLLPGSWRPGLSVTSPWVLFRAASSGWGRAPFWTGLFCTQIEMWLLMSVACFLVPRAWQDRPRAQKLVAASATQPPPVIEPGSTVPLATSAGTAPGPNRLSGKQRETLLNQNPVLWLVEPRAAQRALIWTLAGLSTLCLLALELSANGPMVFALGAAGQLLSLLTIAIYVWTASRASRFFVEARGSGWLEVLLATPLAERQILQGVWNASRRLFFGPVLLFVLMQAFCGIVTQQLMTGVNRGVTPTPTSTNAAGTAGPGLSVTSNANGSTVGSFSYSATSSVGMRPGGVQVAVSGAAPASSDGFLVASIASAALSALATLANLLALSWFGMWMGMTSRTLGIATLRTLAFVQVIPWLGITVASWIGFAILIATIGGGFSASASWVTSSPVWIMVIPSLIASGLVLIKDICFYRWSKRRLNSSLREVAAGNFNRAVRGAPASTANPPPVAATGPAA